MPVYTFYCEKCDVHQDEIRPVDRRNDPVCCQQCAGAMARDIGKEQGAVQTDWTDPLYSDGAGVHPDQVADARARNKNHEYLDDGRMVFRSKSHRDQCLRDIGMHDKDGFG